MNIYKRMATARKGDEDQRARAIQAGSSAEVRFASHPNSPDVDLSLHRRTLGGPSTEPEEMGQEPDRVYRMRRSMYIYMACHSETHSGT